MGWEDPLEKGMATCSSILALKIPWTGEPGRLQSVGSQKESEKLIHFIASCIMLNFSYGPYFKLLILTLCRFLESCKDSTLQERLSVFFTQFLPLTTSYLTVVQYQNQETDINISMYQFSSVQLLSRVRLFETP